MLLCIEITKQTRVNSVEQEAVDAVSSRAGKRRSGAKEQIDPQDYSIDDSRMLKRGDTSITAGSTEG